METSAVGAVGTGVTNEFYEQQRPGYQKLYSNNYYQQARSPAPVAEEAHKASKCCGTPCWGLLGCCGLLGVILGMLFGLGVLGGLPKFGLPGFSLPDWKLPGFGGISIGDLETDGKPVAIDGVDYPADSITITKSIVNFNESQGSEENNENSGNHTKPIVVPPVPVVPDQKPTPVNPVPVTPVEDKTPNTSFMFPPV